MKFRLFLSALVVLGLNTSAQVTTAENGLNTPTANTVQLGGTLLQNTTIDLSGYGFHLKNGNTLYSPRFLMAMWGLVPRSPAAV